MLIMGRGVDNHSNLNCGNTVYILETLPGIKARALKSEIADPSDETRGLASACLFFNLKLENQNVIERSRDCLRNIMGARYRPHFSDFAYMINPGEFDFENPQFLGFGSYGATYKVPWERVRVYDKNGDISYVWGYAVLKIVANSGKESWFERSQLFCEKVRDP
jgi:hypothetical protein